MNPFRFPAIIDFPPDDSLMKGTKTISYWYKRSQWNLFVGIYEDGNLVKAFLNCDKINPDILLVMDEPKPERDLIIWDSILTQRLIARIYNNGTPVDPELLFFQ